MKLVRQPRGSNLCAHAVLATVRGIDLDEAIKILGHRRKTFTRELTKALGIRGKLRVGRPPNRPGTFLLRAAGPDYRRQGHFAILRDGIIYDPEFLYPLSWEIWNRSLWKGWRQTSWLEIPLDIQA